MFVVMVGRAGFMVEQAACSHQVASWWGRCLVAAAEDRLLIPRLEIEPEPL